MIPRKSGISVESTVAGEDVRMAIDESALTHIMGVLTDLYADPELAIIREYSTNALDAHAQAGVTRPIEVSLPTSLRPTFTVRDYGEGLDAEDIRAIYSRYGVSTKRQSNDAVGMLGLGCKSALAYVDQFTLTGIKDGIRTRVSVARDENGAGTMTILDEADTDEAAGVEVAIPAKRGNTLAAKAAAFFRFWPDGLVQLDGAEPAKLEGLALTDELTVVDAGLLEDDVIVMGNVPYPLGDLDLKSGLPRGKHLVARVPIGSVQFTPSREGLQDTATTRATLKQVAADLQKAAAGAAQVAAAAAGTPLEALRAVQKVHDAVGGGWPSVRFDGFVLPSVIERPGDESFWYVPSASLRAGRHGGQYFYGNSCYADSRHVRYPELPLQFALTAVWVTGFENKTWSGAMRRKLWAYAAAENISCERDFVLTSAAGVPAPRWLSGVTAIRWEDVKAWRDPSKPKPAQGGVKYAGTYEATTKDGWQQRFPADQIEKGKRPIFWTPFRSSDFTELQSRFGDCILVRVSSSRQAKFLRLFPTARSANEALAQEAKDWWAKQSKAAHTAVGIQWGYAELPLMAAVDPAELSDPALRKLAEAAKILNHGGIAAAYSGRRRYLPSPMKDVASRKALDRYPLLPSGNIDTLAVQHAVIYVNAAYAASLKGAG